ncbi:putative cyclin-A3-1 [Forsythia ovata]|uniref:Cyclin-A3-1 n=1 Tax=Forsythia ovata TaxID=205694 RepID=A0ABD1QM88_9LAMI
MDDQENRIPTRRRAPKKRLNESVEGLSISKKRVVLGELTNISSNAAGLTLKSDPDKSRKPVPEPKAELKKTTAEEKDSVLVDETANTEIDVVDFHVGPEDDESQKYGHAPLMYRHLHSLEVEAKRRPLSNYVEKVQTDITPSMREILVDWLVEVAEEFKLVSDTPYLTVNYIDRYLSSHDLSRNKLQLLGVSCMLVAAKYEEISPPHVEEYCYMTDNSYSKEEVVHMEMDVLKFLNFEMGDPTTKTFLRIFMKAAQEKPPFSKMQFDFLCCYIAELSLLDYHCVRFIPSTIAASAIFLSRLIIKPKFHPWNLALQKYTGLKPSELKECVLTLHNLQLRMEATACAVREKYMDHKLKCVASLCPPSEIPASYFEAWYEEN